MPALIVCLDDKDPNVVVEATNGLRTITGHSKLAVENGPSLREQWRVWWEARRAKKADAEAEEESTEDASAGALATEGHRILDTLQRALSTQFRPYGDLKGKNLVATPTLSRAASQSMKKVLARTEDPEQPELLTVEMGDDDVSTRDRDSRSLYRAMQNGGGRTPLSWHMRMAAPRLRTAERRDLAEYLEEIRAGRGQGPSGVRAGTAQAQAHQH